MTFVNKMPRKNIALELHLSARLFLRTDKKEANVEKPVTPLSRGGAIGVDLILRLTADSGEVKELKACASFDNVRYGTWILKWTWLWDPWHIYIYNLYIAYDHAFFGGIQTSIYKRGAKETHASGSEDLKWIWTKNTQKLLCPTDQLKNLAAFFFGGSDFCLEHLRHIAAWPQPCNWRIPYFSFADFLVPFFMDPMEWMEWPFQWKYGWSAFFSSQALGRFAPRQTHFVHRRRVRFFRADLFFGVSQKQLNGVGPTIVSLY